MLLSGAAVLMMGNSGGRAAAGGHGNTGAPGENDKLCVTCHNGGPYGPTITLLEVTKGGQLVASYVPGQTYDLELTVAASNGNPGGYGFQLTALDDKNNANVGTFQNLGANVKESAAQNTGGRTYLEHKGGASATRTFTTKWVAPAAKTGAVDFYYIGNVVDGNGAKTGDNGGLGSSITLLEMGAGGLPLPYFEPFNGFGGWEADDGPVAPVGSWEWGLEEGVTDGFPGVWGIVGGGAFGGGLAFLVSPPLDLSMASGAPILSFILNYDTEEDIGGGWLETSVDEGVSWEKVGQSGEGIGWYDGFNLQHGDVWAGSSGDWIYAEHTLEGLAGYADVRVRFVFITEGTTSLDSMGVDDLMIDLDPMDDPPEGGGSDSGSSGGGPELPGYGSTGGAQTGTDDGAPVSTGAGDGSTF